MKTSCKKCLFAEWSNKEQVGCKFHNRLATFQEAELAEKIEDEDGSYYLINRVCNACCTDCDDVEKIEDFIRPTVDYIIVHNNDTPDSELNQRMLEIKGLQHQPDTVYIILIKNLSARDIYLKYSDIGPKLFVVSTYEVLEDEAAACMGLAKSKARYCSTFSSAKQIPFNLITVIDDIINYKLEQLICIRSEDFHGATIAGNINKVYKNSVKITDRIKEVAEVRPDLVREWK